MLNEDELHRLEAACRLVPLTSNEYVASGFVMALFDTVLDYQNHVEVIRKAGDHFKSNRWDDVRTLDDLEAVLDRYPDDNSGNTELALHLWGNRHWRRAHELRGLVVYFRERDVTSIGDLQQWAAGSRPEDFVGHIKGLGRLSTDGWSCGPEWRRSSLMATSCASSPTRSVERSRKTTLFTAGRP